MILYTCYLVAHLDTAANRVTRVETYSDWPVTHVGRGEATEAQLLVTQVSASTYQYALELVMDGAAVMPVLGIFAAIVGLLLTWPVQALLAVLALSDVGHHRSPFARSHTASGTLTGQAAPTTTDPGTHSHASGRRPGSSVITPPPVLATRATTTPAGNSSHAAALGLAPSGERHGRSTRPERTARGERVNTARLTAADIIEARRLRGDGWSLPQLCQRFGLSKSAMHALCTRKTWRHVP